MRARQCAAWCRWTSSRSAPVARRELIVEFNKRNRTRARTGEGRGSVEHAIAWAGRSTASMAARARAMPSVGARMACKGADVSASDDVRKEGG